MYPADKQAVGLHLAYLAMGSLTWGSVPLTGLSIKVIGSNGEMPLSDSITHRWD